jgi:hypothetical protein
MTGTALTRLLDVAEKHARLICIEHQQELLPIFHLCGADGQSYIVAAPFEGDTRDEVTENKDAVAAFVRAMIAEKGIVSYAFISEAWMIVRQKWDARVSTPPSESADRVEVVIATAQDRDGHYEMRRWLIKRDGKKCVDLIVDVTEEEIAGPVGRFDGLFDHLD